MLSSFPSFLFIYLRLYQVLVAVSRLLSSCGVRTQMLWLTGLVAPLACGIPDQGLNLSPMLWKADS